MGTTAIELEGGSMGGRSKGRSIWNMEMSVIRSLASP